MNVAFVENSQDDVNRRQGGEDQNGLRRERVLIGRGRSLKARMDARGHANLALRRLNVLDSSTEGSPRGKVERQSDGRKLALVVNGNRGVGRRVARESAERDQLAGFGSDVDVPQPIGILLVFGKNFENDVILVQTFIDVGDLALAEGVVERVVNGLHGNAETRGGIAVHKKRSLQAMVQLVGVDVPQLRDAGHALQQDGRPVIQVGQNVGLEGVLVLRVAKTAANIDVLNGLEDQSGSGNFREFPAKASNHLVRVKLALLDGLELREHASEIGRAHV